MTRKITVALCAVGFGLVAVFALMRQLNISGNASPDAPTLLTDAVAEFHRIHRGALRTDGKGAVQSLLADLKSLGHVAELDHELRIYEIHSGGASGFWSLPLHRDVASVDALVVFAPRVNAQHVGDLYQVAVAAGVRVLVQSERPPVPGALVDMTGNGKPTLLFPPNTEAVFRLCYPSLSDSIPE